MQDNLNDDFTVTSNKLPTGLNVLTILTIIGSAWGIISGIIAFLGAQKNYDRTKEMLDSNKLESAPGWMKGMITPEMLEVQSKMLENKLPILIVTIVGCALCLYGAIEMRKRKMQGYYVWLIGELLPVAGFMIFIGAMAFKGFGLIGLIFPALFILLYTLNRKDLTN